MSGWRIYALALALFNAAFLVSMLAVVFTDDMMLPARATPQPTPASSVLLVVIFMVANLVGAFRLMYAEDRI